MATSDRPEDLYITLPLEGLARVIDRVTGNPEFARQLRENPLQALRGEGFDVNANELALLLDLPGASEQELAEALKTRTKFGTKVALSFGGGAS